MTISNDQTTKMGYNNPAFVNDDGGNDHHNNKSSNARTNDATAHETITTVNNHSHEMHFYRCKSSQNNVLEC